MINSRPPLGDLNLLLSQPRVTHPGLLTVVDLRFKLAPSRDLPDLSYSHYASKFN
jgi:hypothetical protein